MNKDRIINPEWHDAVVKLADDFRAENIQLKKIIEKQKTLIEKYQREVVILETLSDFKADLILRKEIIQLESELAQLQSQPETQEGEKTTHDGLNDQSADGNYDIHVKPPQSKTIKGRLILSPDPVAKETAESLLLELEHYNPYPESVFTPVSKKELSKVIKLLKDNGYSPDCLYGNWGRKVWDNCVKKAKELFDEDATQSTAHTVTDEKIEKAESGKDKTAKQFIIDNYGENWLHSDWNAGDVMDVMDDFAEHKLDHSDQSSVTEKKGNILFDTMNDD